MGNGSGAADDRTCSEVVATSISPVGRSAFSLPSGRRRTSPVTSTQYSLRRWWASSSRTTTWTYPDASRRSRKTTPPWSRRRATQPARVTVEPASDARSVPASWVRSKEVPFRGRAGSPAVVHVGADALVVHALEVGELGVGQRCEGRGGDVAADLGDVAGAGDHGGDAGLVDDPAEGEGGGRDVGTGDLGHFTRRGETDVERHAGERLADVEGLTVPVEVPVVVGREGRRLVVLAGEQAAGQRHAGEDADTGTGGRGEQLLEGLAPEDVDDH